MLSEKPLSTAWLQPNPSSVRCLFRYLWLVNLRESIQKSTSERAVTFLVALAIVSHRRRARLVNHTYSIYYMAEHYPYIFYSSDFFLACVLSFSLLLSFTLLYGSLLRLMSTSLLYIAHRIETNLNREMDNSTIGRCN